MKIFKENLYKMKPNIEKRKTYTTDLEKLLYEEKIKVEREKYREIRAWADIAELELENFQKQKLNFWYINILIVIVLNVFSITYYSVLLFSVIFNVFVHVFFSHNNY